jgi:hypothetical protein
VIRTPKHLTAEHAARFQDQRVVERYHLRLPYPDETFDRNSPPHVTPLDRHK